MRYRATSILSFIVSFAAFSVSSARSQTIFAPSASTIFQDGNQVASRVELVSGNPKTLTSIPVTIVYGPGPSFTTAVTVPYFNRQEQGIGDIGLTIKYRLHFAGGRAQFLQWAAIANVKLPTGSTSRGLGTGSTDITFGTALNKVQNLQWFYNGSMLYSVRGKGSGGLDPGDAFLYNLVTAFRPYVPPYPPTWSNPEVWGVIELLGSLSPKDKVNGKPLSDTGGHLILASLGIQVLPLPYLLIEAAIQVPVLEDLNGGKKAPDRKVVSGLRWFF